MLIDNLSDKSLAINYIQCTSTRVYFKMCISNLMFKIELDKNSNSANIDITSQYTPNCKILFIISMISVLYNRKKTFCFD